MNKKHPQNEMTEFLKNRFDAISKLDALRVLRPTFGHYKNWVHAASKAHNQFEESI